eukprot:GFUD01001511.1.p1 GENE.GFUD01001511.1~~GFUD01001511.1.p1  ORF type:complete len:396 (+),score=91.78 GFUD01001511.1:127-1314(+)
MKEIVMTRPNKTISKVLLAGLYDQECPLSMLRGCPHLLRTIWNQITAYWREVVELPIASPTDGRFIYGCDLETSNSSFYLSPISCGSFEDEEAEYSFPPPADINIEMMPFMVGKSFASCKLPESVRPYWGMIKAALTPEMNRACYHMWPSQALPSDVGKVNYLTIKESYVEIGTSQRRPGLHVDSPGKVILKKEDGDNFVNGKGSSQPYRSNGWGRGCAHFIDPHYSEIETNVHIMKDGGFVLNGGIYVASSIPSSCRAWNCSITPAAVGRLGDIEHMREALPGPGVDLQAGRLYWLSDRTPHESLALPKGSYRQFFRLVTSQVSLWYKDHSTPNPLGVVPDPRITRTVVGNKFDGDGLNVVEETGSVESRMEEVEQQNMRNQKKSNWHGVFQSV